MHCTCTLSAKGIHIMKLYFSLLKIINYSCCYSKQVLVLSKFIFEVSCSNCQFAVCRINNTTAGTVCQLYSSSCGVNDTVSTGAGPPSPWYACVTMERSWASATTVTPRWRQRSPAPRCWGPFPTPTGPRPRLPPPPPAGPPLCSGGGHSSSQAHLLQEAALPPQSHKGK